MQYQFKRSQLVNTDLKTLWDFASSPKNLSRITPDYMNFKIKSSLPDKGMYPGMMIIYTVCPLLKLPMTWITEITSVENGSYFVDEQRVGPYKMWHHEHHFEQKENELQAQLHKHLNIIGKHTEYSWWTYIRHFIIKN